jgi:UDP-3-O-[3-hydroxymyristoyl] glucosamine N-acyltransferase
MNNTTKDDHKIFSLKYIKLPKSDHIFRDSQFAVTHYATSNLKNTLCFVENEGYLLKANKNDNISCIITFEKFKEDVNANKGLIISESPKMTFFNIHNQLFEKYSYKDAESVIHENAEIHPTAVIGNGVQIGEGTKIGAYSVIEDGSIIGNNVLVESHVVIGGRGMHNTKIEGRFIKVKDLGNVIIEDDCEILSHAVVQKPYFYHSTIIGADSRISVGCNIGHGCNIGPSTIIAGHSVIAGYCNLGKGVWVGPNSTIAHMTEIGNFSSVILGSVLIENVGIGAYVSGNFALDHATNIKKYIRAKRGK